MVWIVRFTPTAFADLFDPLRGMTDANGETLLVTADNANKPPGANRREDVWLCYVIHICFRLTSAFRGPHSDFLPSFVRHMIQQTQNINPTLKLAKATAASFAPIGSDCRQHTPGRHAARHEKVQTGCKLLPPAVLAHILGRSLR